MPKAISYIIFIFFLGSFCFAQNNPITAIDSNLKSIQENVSVKVEVNKHALDSGLQNILTNLPVPPNPFISTKDTVNIFDTLHGKLTVLIKNLYKVIGSINIAIFNNHLSFVNNGPLFRGAIIPVTALNMSVLFDSIPKGIYSVAVFHDEDKNGMLNKNKMNIPLEGYGFSNNASGNLGPPNFAQTKFIYTGKNKTITIYMTYFKFPK